MIKTTDARDRAFELVESGATSPMELLMACLQYMSTDEVADMLDYNGYAFDELDEEDTDNV